MKRITKLIVTAVIAVACLLAVGCVRQGAEGVFGDYNPQYSSVVTVGGFTLDGKADESAYEGVREYNTVSTRTGRAQKYEFTTVKDARFTAKVTFTDEALVMHTDTDDSVINTDPRISAFGRTAFIAYIGGADYSYELTLCADNTGKLRRNLRGSSYTGYPMRIKTGVDIREDGWAAEWYIPWTEIGFDSRPEKMDINFGMIRNDNTTATAGFTYENFGSEYSVHYTDTNTWQTFTADGWEEPQKGETLGYVGEYFTNKLFDLSTDRGEDAYVKFDGIGSPVAYFNDFYGTKFYAEATVTMDMDKLENLGRNWPRVGFAITGERTSDLGYTGNRTVSPLLTIRSKADADKVYDIKERNEDLAISSMSVTHRLGSGANDWGNTADSLYINTANSMGASVVNGNTTKVAVYRDGQKFVFLMNGVVTGTMGFDGQPTYPNLGNGVKSVVGITSWNVPCVFTDYRLVGGEQADAALSAALSSEVYDTQKESGKLFYKNITGRELLLSATLRATAATGDDPRAGIELVSRDTNGLGYQGRINYAVEYADGTTDFARISIIPYGYEDENDTTLGNLWGKKLTLTKSELMKYYPTSFDEEYFERGVFALSVYRKDGQIEFFLNGNLIFGSSIVADAPAIAREAELLGNGSELDARVCIWGAAAVDVSAEQALNGAAAAGGYSNLTYGVFTVNALREDRRKTFRPGDIVAPDDESGYYVSSTVTGSSLYAKTQLTLTAVTDKTNGSGAVVDPRIGVSFRTLDGLGRVYALLHFENSTTAASLSEVDLKNALVLPGDGTASDRNDWTNSYAVNAATLTTNYDAIRNSSKTYEIAAYMSGGEIWVTVNGKLALRPEDFTEQNEAIAAMFDGKQARVGLVSLNAAAYFTHMEMLSGAEANEAFASIDKGMFYNTQDRDNRTDFLLAGSTADTPYIDYVGTSGSGDIYFPGFSATEFYMETGFAVTGASTLSESRVGFEIWTEDKTDNAYGLLSALVGFNSSTEANAVVAPYRKSTVSSNNWTVNVPAATVNANFSGLIPSGSAVGKRFTLGLYYKTGEIYITLNGKLIISPTTYGAVDAAKILGGGKVYGGLTSWGLPVRFYGYSVVTGAEAYEKIAAADSRFGEFGNSNGADKRSTFTYSDGVATTTATGEANIFFEQSRDTVQFVKTTVSVPAYTFGTDNRIGIKLQGYDKVSRTVNGIEQSNKYGNLHFVVKSGSAGAVFNVVELVHNGLRNNGTTFNNLWSAYSGTAYASHYTSLTASALSAKGVSASAVTALNPSGTKPAAVTLALYRSGSVVKCFVDGVLVIDVTLGDTATSNCFIGSSTRCYAGITAWNTACSFSDTVYASGAAATAEYNKMVG